MKNINFKIILIQWLGIIFLIQGILKLKFASKAEEYMCVVSYFENKESECWNKFVSHYKSVGEFTANIYIWAFYGFLFGLIIVAYMNFKNKISYLNTIIISIALFSLFPIRFFRRGFISVLFNSFGPIFTDNFGLQNLIGGITFTLIGILILWKSAGIGKSTTHNSGFMLWRGLGFFGLVSACISSLKRSFFFPLFGIFVNVSNKKPATA